ncbi:hypothetical protein F5Y04DRAFT_288089 [Hypomontagnella monticulosa]|nr:hypothetical protein F5Y04DRAFT_288089 [Hypomontagnella monticulosa]
MALCEKTEGQDDDNSRWGVIWKSGKVQQYPPPAALPDYINRALPPRPDSRSSSTRNSSNDSTQQHPSPRHQLLIIKDHDDSNADITGTFDDDELATVQPLQIITPATPHSRPQTGIVCPQSKYSTHAALKASQGDDYVSPLSAPFSGTHQHQQYEVSPVSAGESAHSIDSILSESNRASGISHDSSTQGEMSLYHPGRRQRLCGIDHHSRWSRDAPARPPPPSQYQVEQINLRYSDPGSPISGAVIHPPSSFPSDPNLRFSRELDEHDRHPVETYHTYMYSSRANPYHNTLNRAATTSTTGSSKVAFAGTIDGFSARARANSRRTAGPPPPLKLFERPLVDKYVKTPFPSGVPGLQHDDPRAAPQPKISRKKQTGDEGKKNGKGDRGRGDSGDGGAATKKLSRTASLHKFAFPKGLMRRPSQKVSEARAAEQGDEGMGQERRAEPIPRVRSILTKAKQFSWGHGFGIGAGSEEARKEKRREEMKRQIRVTDLR